MNRILAANWAFQQNNKFSNLFLFLGKALIILNSLMFLAVFLAYEYVNEKGRKYFLHKKGIFYYFSKKESGAIDLPEGMKVRENLGTGMPIAIHSETFQKMAEKVKKQKDLKLKKSKSKKSKKHKTRVVVLLERQPVEVIKEIFKECSPAEVKQTIEGIISNKEKFLPEKSKLRAMNKYIARRWHRFYREANIPEPFWYLYSVKRDNQIEPSLQLINLYYKGEEFYAEPKEFQQEIKHIIDVEMETPTPTLIELPATTKEEWDEKTFNLSLKEIREFETEHGRTPNEDEMDKMSEQIYRQLLKTQIIEQ